MPLPSVDELSDDLLHTPLCDLLGCRYPLILAGMGGVARAELVTAVTLAGAFGFLGMVREPPELIQEEVAKVRQGTSAAFGVNLIPAATEPGLLTRQVELCIALAVPVVGLFWNVSPSVIGALRAAGIKVVHQVGSVAEALQAQEAGAHALIVQGTEAGGHVRSRQGLDELLPKVLAVAGIPVAAAGGIAAGADVARLLTQGAQAAVLGTALLATRESFAHDFHKLRVVQARATDTILTEAFHVNWPPNAPVRVLKNSVTSGQRGDPFRSPATVIGHELERPIYLFSTDSPLRTMTGDYEAMALYAGCGVEHIREIVPAGQRVASIVAEAVAARGKARRAAVGVASPVCYADETGDDQTTEALRPQILARLDELLEAERAGARLTLRTAAELQDDSLRELVDLVHHDEVKWCAMLARQIRKLHGTPSTRTGAFYDKAIGIGDLPERLAFLNRGQGWVVRKLRELMPMVADPEIVHELGEMLDAHRTNIDKVNDRLAHGGDGPS
ncbi:MAG: nitronate monooxygenase [Pigmentiphaga sp.]|nr:nitronate monooxygenase [Pigmentiphaga sp.]